MSLKRFCIVTGSSRGLGAALVRMLLERGYSVLGIARTPNPDLRQYAAALKADYEELHLDLNDIRGSSQSWQKWLDNLQGRQFEQLSLINNAGILEPISMLPDASTEDLITNINVNLTAPLTMSALFINATPSCSIDRRIINISSGAGRKPMPGWGAYCSAKAGMDHMTRVIDSENKYSDHPVKIVSLAPGILDTAMQARIRQSTIEDFPDLERFLDFKTSNLLSEPADVAGRIILNFLESDFESGGILDIRDYQ